MRVDVKVEPVRSLREDALLRGVDEAMEFLPGLDGLGVTLGRDGQLAVAIHFLPRDFADDKVRGATKLLSQGRADGFSEGPRVGVADRDAFGAVGNILRHNRAIMWDGNHYR